MVRSFFLPCILVRVLVAYEGVVMHVLKLAAAFAETLLHHMRVVFEFEVVSTACHRQMRLILRISNSWSAKGRHLLP